MHEPPLVATMLRAGPGTIRHRRRLSCENQTWVMSSLASLQRRALPCVWRKEASWHVHRTEE